MKKLICYILIISNLFIFGGCGKKKVEQPQINNNNFDIRMAVNVVDTYMLALMRDDYVGSKKYLIKDLMENSKNRNSSELKILEYKVDDVQEIGKYGVVKVKVVKGRDDQPFSSLEEYVINVVKDSNDYKISEISSNVLKEAFVKLKGIRLKNNNDVKTNLVISSNGIPKYAFSKDDKSNVQKLKVPNSSFSRLTLAYGGKTLAVATSDNNHKNSFCCVVQIEDTKETQGKQEKENSIENEKEMGEDVIEKPIGKQVVPIDILENSTIEFMVFSLDEKYVLIQYKKNNRECIRVYRVDSGDIIPIKLEDNYPVDKVDVKFSSFDKESLNYQVTPKDRKDTSCDKIVGKWQLNLNDFKIKKL